MSMSMAKIIKWKLCAEKCSGLLNVWLSVAGWLSVKQCGCAINPTWLSIDKYNVSAKCNENIH